jgi:hypothetical protein
MDKIENYKNKKMYKYLLRIIQSKFYFYSK